MNVNSVTISGNLTRDPELRQTRGGGQILVFSIAVNERRRNAASGEWVDYTNYFECVAFGSTATWGAKYLHRGTKATVSGKLGYSSWEKDGQRHSKVNIRVDTIDPDFRKSSAPQPTDVDQNAEASPKGKFPDAGYNQAGYSQQASQVPQTQEAPLDQDDFYQFFDSDIPF